MIESRWALLGLAWALAAAIQLVLYLRQRRTGNATAVDAGWAASLVLIGLLYLVLADGGLAHRVLVAAMVGLENLRIARLVLARIGTGEEDSRYQELRARWRRRNQEQVRFFVFYQAQALIAVLLSLPILLAACDEDPLGPLAYAGAALWLAAAGLERTADRQLERFKADSANHARVLDSGLWRYSRHPNYFFQWLTWIAYAVVALEAPDGWLGLAAPALILVLILFVTGIPPSEQSSLRSRGDEYRRYQQRTSAFVPWFRREAAGASVTRTN